MNGIIFFIVLPYMALISLILGSIYRYWFRGFRVSSLSSQLLENRLLFFGNRPFHWGIITLLIGHLIGFFIPGNVMAWNGKPFRLYVLEITAISFDLLTLTGLVVLIVRRLKIKRIQVVTTKMDIFVFILLVTIVITGISTAVFYRWGSSWFALIIVPYLRSVLTFNPNTTEIMTLPFMIKLHMISTFTFFGIIPFTRLIHMLVYPFSYFWRNYQVVVWNKRKNNGDNLFNHGIH